VPGKIGRELRGLPVVEVIGHRSAFPAQTDLADEPRGAVGSHRGGDLVEQAADGACAGLQVIIVTAAANASATAVAVAAQGFPGFSAAFRHPGNRTPPNGV
jgi:hypothetical protein